MKNNYLIKNLIFGLKKKSGHNNLGRITVCNLGGGSKRLYRILDYKRKLDYILGSVIEIQYDPNRSGYIALICYSNGALSYILSPDELNVGDKIISGDNVLFKIGNASYLKNIPAGSLIYNLELYPNQGGKLVRAAGTSALILRKFNKQYTVVKLPSGVERLLHNHCRATLGRVSNILNLYKKKSKAGQNRWLGKKPSVRGVAMNPIDHPHGGGEGKKSGKRLTPWGYHIDRKLKKKNRFILTKYGKK